MSVIADTRPATRWQYGLALVLVLGVGVLLPCIGLSGRWLWIDELLSANFAAHGPWATLVMVLRFDVHPPLYYLQLSLWMLIGQSDLWLMANSIFWHIAAIALLTLGATRFHGPRIGLAAGVLLAVSPAALFYADQVRMYAFLIFLIIWVWYAQERWLRGNAGWSGAFLVFVSQISVALSHTAGLLMLSGCVVLGAWTVWAAGRKARIRRWLLIEAAVAVFSLPTVTIGVMRKVEHLRAPGAPDVIATWNFLTSGAAWFGPPSMVVGLGVAVVLALGCLRDRRLRLPALSLICGPLLIALVMSHLVTPLWINRVFVTIIPFVCLCLAGATLERAMPRRVGAVALVALVVLWGTNGIAGQLTRQKGDGYRLAATVVQDVARAGDVVLVDGDLSYWSFMWYFAGPRWGQPRQAFILSADWEQMMQRLPAWVPEAAGLGDSDVSVRVGGVTAMLWDRRRPAPEARGDILVLRSRRTEPAGLPGRRVAGAITMVQLVLERLEREP